MFSIFQKFSSFLSLRKAIKSLSSSQSSSEIQAIIDQMIYTRNTQNHLWKKLADELDSDQPLQQMRSPLSDTIDLAFKLEHNKIGLKESIGTEPLKSKIKEKTKLSRRALHQQRILRWTLNQFMVQSNKQKYDDLLLTPEQTARLAYLLGMYSQKSASYPVSSRKLLQHEFWSHRYALWTKLDKLVQQQCVYMDQFEIAMASYGMSRAQHGSAETWQQFKLEIETNLNSHVFLRENNTSNQQELVALVQTAEVLTSQDELFRDRTWRELEQQLLYKVQKIEQANLRLAFNELCGLSYAVIRRSPLPTCKPLVKYVERELLQNVKRIEKQDFRLLIHLIANICLHDFGSDQFHREFVSLDNLKKLAGV